MCWMLSRTNGCASPRRAGRLPCAGWGTAVAAFQLGAAERAVQGAQAALHSRSTNMSPPTKFLQVPEIVEELLGGDVAVAARQLDEEQQRRREERQRQQQQSGGPE